MNAEEVLAKHEGVITTRSYISAIESKLREGESNITGASDAVAAAEAEYRSAIQLNLRGKADQKEIARCRQLWLDAVNKKADDEIYLSALHQELAVAKAAYDTAQRQFINCRERFWRELSENAAAELRQHLPKLFEIYAMFILAGRHFDWDQHFLWAVFGESKEHHQILFNAAAELRRGLEKRFLGELPLG